MAFTPKKKETKKQDVEFVKGLFIKTVETKFGEILKLGFNIENFCENEISETGFINIELKKNKDGKWYAVIQPKLDK